MKHPLLENRTRLLMWWLAWLMVAAGQSLLIFYVYGGRPAIAITDGLVSMALYGLLGLAIWFPLNFLLKETRQPTTYTVINIVLTGSLTVAAWLLFSRIITRALVSEKYEYEHLWHSLLVLRVTAGILFFFMIMLVYYLFDSAARLAEKATLQARLETQVREGELRVLRSQINPHFLFNSLNSISSLTLTDPCRAREMIIKLSDFMRYSLSSKGEQPVTLHSELVSLRLYLQIEKVRFEERLEITEEISPDILEALIPSMLLQPLYENAIIHGVYEATGTINLITTGKREKEMVLLTITNNIDRDTIVTRKGAGIGLKNVSSRLRLFYGEEASLTVSHLDESFSVTLRFPFIIS